MTSNKISTLGLFIKFSNVPPRTACDLFDFIKTCDFSKLCSLCLKEENHHSLYELILTTILAPLIIRENRNVQGQQKLFIWIWFHIIPNGISVVIGVVPSWGILQLMLVSFLLLCQVLVKSYPFVCGTLQSNTLLSSNQIVDAVPS